MREYDEAIEIFESLGRYRDSKTKIKKCIYGIGMEHLKSSE